MSKIVGIGANVYDTLITLPFYPEEDTKLGANSVTISGGGPCATALVTASKLGGQSSYIGVLSDDNGGKYLKEDMEKYGVSTDLVQIKSGYNSFCSYIWLSNKTSSRTCVFNKGNLPSLKLDENQINAIKSAELMIIDGNENKAAKDACKIAKENNTKILYDAGGLYDGVEEILPYADILIPSEEFALGFTKTQNVEDAAKILFKNYSPDILVITQGKDGGIIYDGKSIKKYPAFLVDAIDSNGSGDVFHGAFAYAYTKGYDYYKACIFSSAVSALKCTKLGARVGVPTFEETIKFIKERGYDEL